MINEIVLASIPSTNAHIAISFIWKFHSQQINNKQNHWCLWALRDTQKKTIKSNQCVCTQICVLQGSKSKASAEVTWAAYRVRCGRACAMFGKLEVSISYRETCKFMTFECNFHIVMHISGLEIIFVDSYKRMNASIDFVVVVVDDALDAVCHHIHTNTSINTGNEIGNTRAICFSNQ